MNFIARTFLKKYIEANKVEREKRLTSLEKAKDIGLICKITNEDSYKEINAIFTGLQQFNRTLWLVGYCKGKIIPFYCLQQLTADFFCDKDMNWYGKPMKVQLNDFLKRDFDILIDFTHDENEPVRTLLTLTNAKCIAGANDSNKDFYDLSIDTQEEITSQELLDQINLYTKQLTGDNEQ